MPYVSDGRKLIEHAFRHGYALPAFNFCSLEMAKACVEAAEELQALVILQTYPVDLSFSSPRVMAGMVRALAEEAGVPVMLHLDHGGGLGAVVECLRAGYSSVMLDGGGMALAQVLEATRWAVGLGVAKVNVGSASYRALLRVWCERAGELSTHCAVYAEARAAVGEQARNCIALLGAAGKAKLFSA
ncbi:MAG: hypothetical protein C4342_00215 [Armatimonadota bacterium]